MDEEMLNAMVSAVRQTLREVGDELDDKGERIFREAMLTGHCVKIMIPRRGGACTVNDIGVVEPRATFYFRGAELNQLKIRFDGIVTEWVSERRQKKYGA